MAVAHSRGIHTHNSSIALAAGLLASTFIAAPAGAGTFDNGIPNFWTCTGVCGVSAADGVVGLAPGGGSKYGWIATTNSSAGASLAGVGGEDLSNNGTSLRSLSFDASAGQELKFSFNYISSDGAEYTDYAWARLLDYNNQQVALLVAARTGADGKVVPGFDMPPAAATLMPASVPLIDGATKWSPLGDRSDDCYDTGCGATGWVQAKYRIAATGIYRLEFGVTNWDDSDFDSGLAFDAISIGGAPLPVPEPASYAMLLAGMSVLGAAARRRSKR